MFGKDPPASTLIPVTTLALEALEFEIDAVAVTVSNDERSADTGVDQ